MKMLTNMRRYWRTALLKKILSYVACRQGGPLGAAMGEEAPPVAESGCSCTTLPEKYNELAEVCSTSMKVAALYHIIVA